MSLRRIGPVLAFLAVAGVVGCSDDRAPLAPLGESSLFAGAAAVRDSHPPKPPKPEPIPIVVFAGSDRVEAGETSITRWVLGNDLNQTQTLTWTLTDDAGWPTLPLSGRVSVPSNSTQLLEVPVAVPAGTTPGPYTLLMSVTLKNQTGLSGGSIPVAADSIPPDSLRYGGSRSDR